MLSHGLAHTPSRVEAQVVDEVARALTIHLDAWAPPQPKGTRSGPDRPVMVHVDGAGRTLFLDKLDHRLATNRDPWTVVRFDAWQFQRVPPPWWWLLKAIDTTLRKSGGSGASRRRVKDAGWRAWRLIKDLAVVFPAIVIALAVAFAARELSGEKAFVDALKWATTALAAVVTLLGVGWSATNALRRHLLAQSPLGATAVLRTSDPMAEVERRYAFLVRSAGGRIAILIDNLDRCRADYVVELLEGIQTLLRQPHAAGDLPGVVFVVAAQRTWLCDSYVSVYDEYERAARQPGRPAGLTFLDKIFDLSIRLPTVSAAASLADADPPPNLDEACAAIEAAPGEMAVRGVLVAAEREAAAGGPVRPVHEFRVQAARRLMDLERGATACYDTDQELVSLARRLDPGPVLLRQFPSAYCVQRIRQLLAGHAIDDEAGAIRRLGLWTLVSLRWPVLAARLAKEPEFIARLTAPEEADEDLTALLAQTAVGDWALAASQAGLDAAAIARLARPIRLCEPHCTLPPGTVVEQFRGVPAPLGSP